MAMRPERNRIMAAERVPLYTPEQYLEMEEDAEFKSEYISGEIFALAGATPRHVTINNNIASELHSCFKGRPCQAYANDLRVTVVPTGLRTYPDVIAVCGEPQFHPDDQNSLTNPTVLVEVLSPKTEAFDRGEKFAHFRRLDSFQEYVLVSQNRVRVEHFARQPDGRWLLTELSEPSQTLALSSVGCQIPLSDIYDRVRFEEAPAAPSSAAS